MSSVERFYAPPDVAAEARKGLALREQFGRGGTDVGLRRGRQLARRQAVSRRDITAMSAYFARHAVDKEAKGHVWGDESNPSAGYVAWLLWGGEPGRTWAETIKANAARPTRAQASKTSRRS